MDKTQLEQLENNFATFRDMIAEIFNVSGGEVALSFANPSELIFTFSNRVVVGFSEFTHSDLYSFFVGVALIFLMTNFIIKNYEENQVLKDDGFFSQRMLKKYVAFITCLILIYWMRSIIYFILALFRFVLYFAVDITDSVTGITDISGIFDANTISFRILDAEKVFDGTALIDETIARSKEAALRNLYFVPWVIAWVSKLGIVVIVMENAIKLLTYASVYVLSISDVVHGLKDSRLINYTKNIIALAFQQIVIVLILYFFKIVCNPYLKQILSDVMSAKGNYLSLAIIFVSVQTAKLITLIGSKTISKRAFGVK
ncbi:MAG: hypothetical protein Q4F88_05160 [Eubacteriales bacterium]|nr:hypothetical protein [Eubacteriales bacterium]